MLVAQGDTVGLNVKQPVPLLLGLSLELPVENADTVSRVVREGLPVPLPLLLGLVEARGLAEEEVEGLRVAVTEGEAVSIGEMLGGLLPLEHTVDKAVAVKQADGVGETALLGETLSWAEDVALTVESTLTFADTEPEAELQGLALWEREATEVVVGLADQLVAPLPVGSRVIKAVTEGVGDKLACEALGERDALALPLPAAEIALESEALMLCVEDKQAMEELV